MTAEEPIATAVDEKQQDAGSLTKGQLRGSSLLLSGRMLSLAINFGVQVLIARYLSREDYGAFAYVLSLVVLGQTIATLGLDRGVSRFLAHYDERRDYDRLLGTLVMVIGTVVSIGTALVVLVAGLRSQLTGTLIDDRTAVSLLVVMIALAPIQAADDLLTNTLAVFSNARAIFLRKYVLAPSFRFAVVLLLVLQGRDVQFLGVGYVVTGAVGVLIYVGILWRSLGERGIRQHLRLRSMQVPFREILTFTLPLLTTDLVYVAVNTSAPIMLGHFDDATTVGAFRVVQPLVNLNTLVFASFTVLYMPVASRLAARKDDSGIADLYWRTAIWVAVFSFPIFVITTSLARPVTEGIFGERYSDSAVYLALLSLGYYANAAFGFNGLTLRVFGYLRYIVCINVVAVMVNLGLNLVLIPRYGALGAAISTTATLLLHNALKQIGLRGTGIDVFHWQYLRVYLTIAVCGVAVLATERLVNPSLVVSLLLGVVASLAVLRLNRRLLDVESTFPELRKVPGLRQLLRTK